MFLLSFREAMENGKTKTAENIAPFTPSSPTLSIFRRIATKVDILAKNGPRVNKRDKAEYDISFAVIDVKDVYARVMYVYVHVSVEKHGARVWRLVYIAP